MRISFVKIFVKFRQIFMLPFVKFYNSRPSNRTFQFLFLYSTRRSLIVQKLQRPIAILRRTCNFPTAQRQKREQLTSRERSFATIPPPDKVIPIYNVGHFSGAWGGTIFIIISPSSHRRSSINEVSVNASKCRFSRGETRRTYSTERNGAVRVIRNA